MKAAAIKIKTYANNNVNIVNNNDLTRRALRFMILSMVLLAVAYSIVLGNMVVNIVQRRNLDSEARTLSSDVSNLQLSYLSTSNKIDLDLSHSLGFKEVKTEFATRKSLGSIKFENNEL